MSDCRERLTRASPKFGMWARLSRGVATCVFAVDMSCEVTNDCHTSLYTSVGLRDAYVDNVLCASLCCLICIPSFHGQVKEGFSS